MKTLVCPCNETIDMNEPEQVASGKCEACLTEEKMQSHLNEPFVSPALFERYLKGDL